MTMEKKIFGIGLSRTGTSSLINALRMLDISAVHFPKDIDDILGHQASADSPIAAAYPNLDRAFTKSRFILTIRNKDDWLESCRQHWARHQAYFDESPELTGLHEILYGARNFERDIFAETWERHLREVRGYFAGRATDLLEVDICAGQGWETLCPFLDMSEPSLPFPHDNIGTAFDHLLIRLLSASRDVDWVSKISDVGPQYMVRLITSEAFRRHDPKSPMLLDVGRNFQVTFNRAVERFETVERLTKNLVTPHHH